MTPAPVTDIRPMHLEQDIESGVYSFLQELDLLKEMATRHPADLARYKGKLLEATRQLQHIYWGLESAS